MYKTQFIQRLNSFSPNSVCVVSSSMDESVPFIGRPYGGCSIIWPSNISCKVDTIEYISKRLCAVKVTVDGIEFVLFNMYMPCDKGYANHDFFEYIDVLNDLSDICNKTASQYFVLGGDFNTDLTRDTPQTRALHSFVNNEQMFLCIDAECSNIPYTYCSKSNGCKSTIDHFMVIQNLHESIIKYESVFMKSDFSDHVPICLDMQIDVSYHESFERKCKTNVAWHKCTEVHIENYKCELDKLILCIDFNHDAVSCVDYQCKRHTGFFSDLYNTVVNSCIVASDMCLPKTGAKKGSSKVIPGWNEHVQAQHDTSLFWHDIWVQCGRPHNGEVADIMRRTRSGYHYAVRYVIKEETRIKSNRMAEAISEGNDRNLWKEVHSLNKSCHFLMVI